MPIEANLRRVTFVIGISIFRALPASPALANPPPASPPSAPTVQAPAGLAVVALAGATSAAWPLARSVYAVSSLKAVTIDEGRAHVLCGEAPLSDAPAEARDLADTVAALHGDDAPSRALLGDLARRLSAQAVVVVRVDAGRPSARVFLADTGSFDAATYTPDEGAPLSWSAATISLMRSYGSRPLGAPVLATHQAPRVESAPRAHEFYESGWFWGALGAAAFAGGAIFLATRDNAPATIHLQLEVAH